MAVANGPLFTVKDRATRALQTEGSREHCDTWLSRVDIPERFAIDSLIVYKVTCSECGEDFWGQADNLPRKIQVHDEAHRG